MKRKQKAPASTPADTPETPANTRADLLLAAANAIDKPHSNAELFDRRNKKKYTEPPNIRRRPPQRTPTLITDIYISKSTNFIAALRRSRKVLNNPKHGYCTIHGLGAMVLKAASIALRIDDEDPGVYERIVTTSSVACFDDVEDLNNEEQDPHVTRRDTSAIHIRITKKRGVSLV
ncbi:hypothetical protein SeMB42_g04662 [Synchytrium endobioticum]|uniref:Uncharacterized protein n=1 Tax=Synchytrium endobioticum TaxID=286115 RepID=A0A507CKL7_9FUNG|nr:hypothetical protein SeLEV6574_g06686 [Synchytrium endobioticum]TPX43624.1 hypothetical protein SeMB42_g04662 [Synchytrium endobioticum]